MRSPLTVLLATFALSGCAVVSVASTAVGVAATAASVAVDATVGTAKVVGGALMPSRSDK
jgi:hypothetical protein